jgi:threonine dehydratase
MVRMAEARIRPHVRETALEPSPDLASERGSVHLKLENQQVTGSFKVRGAFNRLLCLSDEERLAGIVTASAGNHGIGVAHAAATLAVPTTVIVPMSVDLAKRSQLERYSIDLILIGDSFEESEDAAIELAKATNKVFVSPYNDPEVIAGQGTIGVEIARQLVGVDVVFLAVGGGGLLSGVASYLKGVNPELKIVAVSPSNSPAMFDELAGTPYEFRAITETLSDGTAGLVQDRSITIDLCRALIDQWVLVEEVEIVAAMKFLFFEHRIVAEGAGALTVAAYLKERERYEGLAAVLVVCGGNIEMRKFCSLI